MSFIHTVCRFLLKIEWLLLLALLPFVFLGNPAFAPFLLIIPLIWLARKVVHGRFLPATPLIIPLFLLYFMILVSEWATFDMAFSYPKIAGLVYGLAVVPAVVATVDNSPRKLWLGVALLLLAGWGVMALGALSVQWAAKFPLLAAIVNRLPERLVQLPGLQGALNANQLAGVLSWVAPLALVLAGWGVWSWRRRAGQPAWLFWGVRLALAVTAVASNLLLLFTQSRSGLSGLIVAGAFLAAILLWQWGKRPFFITTALAIITMAALFYAIGPEKIQSALSEQAHLDITSDGIGSLETRIEIWSRAIYGIQDFPFTGMGMNTFRRVVPILYPLFLIAPDIDIAHAHNQWLQTALDLGIPGLIAYLSVWLLTAVMLWQTWQQAKDPWLKALALGMAASLAAYFVYAMTDTIALGGRPGFIFWLLIGLVNSMWQITNTRNPKSVSRFPTKLPEVEHTDY